MAVDEKILNRVRGLLNKAENTPYEEEAATFLKSAQSLIAKYAIDQEALWKNDPSKREQVHTEDVTIKDKVAGSHYRRMVLHQIAINNNCRTWYTPGADRSTVAGFPSDTLFVVMLYTSIMTQMNFSMAHALARYTAEGRSTRTFRKSFTAGYCDRIVSRLQEIRRAQQAELRQQVNAEGTSTDLVLRSRAQKVDDWVDANIHLSAGTWRDSGRHDSQARGAGHMAANTADLSGGRGGQVSGGKRALPQ